MANPLIDPIVPSGFSGTTKPGPSWGSDGVMVSTGVPVPRELRASMRDTRAKQVIVMIKIFFLLFKLFHQKCFCSSLI